MLKRILSALQRPLLTGFIFIFFCHFSFSQTPSPVACYNFSGNLNEANGGTPLTSINGTGTYSDSASTCGTDSFYNWALDQGLDLSIGTLFPKNNYTLEFRFKFTGYPYNRLWQRIVNFKNSTSDEGLYSYGSGANFNLQMYTQNTGTSNMAVPGAWLHLFLTRDSVTQIMQAYINDSLQISFTDGAAQGIFISDLILFKDDNVVPNEESPGSIDYLRIYNQPLSRAEISYIVNMTAPVVSISGNLSVCPGDSTLLTATGATSYLWSNGAMTSSVYVSPDSTMNYSVMGWNNLFCTNSCMTYDTVTVAVNSTLQATAGPDTSVCGGTEVQLMSSGGTSYSWSPGTYLSDSTIDDPITYALATTTYTVTVTNGNCSATATSVITALLSPPTPLITLSHDTLYCSFDSSYSSYQWYADSVLIPGATGPSLYVTADGNYNIKLENNDHCSVAAGINVILNGIHIYPEGSTPAALHLSPNPVARELRIEASAIDKVDIYNVMGEKEGSFTFPQASSSSVATIDVSSFAAGMYFVRVEGRNSIASGRFIKTAK